MAAAAACPANSFPYNGTLCACNPGYVMEPAAGACTLFRVSPEEWAVGTGVDYALNVAVTIFSFEITTKLTNSQAVFLEATVFAVVSWLVFCFSLRRAKMKGGKSRWFTIRWWISRLDFVYSTRHWLDDQKVVKKRKTELGGTFSVACWMLFIGLLAALLYQIFARRQVEVHNVKPTNAPDLALFVNDMEFNITTISSMSCANLRGLDTLATGTPGSVGYRLAPLSSIANSSCHNSSRGPTVTIRCNRCQIPRDNYFISWQFVDLPGNPAMAVGFQFNLTARAHNDNRHITFVSGTLKNGSNDIERPNTFRGQDVNVLQFHLFPRLYRNFHDLKLIQPLLHEFLPGSSLLETSQLQASLQNSKDGVINTTFHVNFISDYIVEINSQNVLGPVGFLADVGGLYAFCIAIFLYSLLLFECKIKKFRGEDLVMRNVRSRRRAQVHWDKLRKYVVYTFGVNQLDEGSSRHISENWVSESLGRPGSIHKRKSLTGDSICLERATKPAIETVLKNEVKKEDSSASVKNDAFQPHAPSASKNAFHLPPVPEISLDSGTDVLALQKNLRSLHNYSALLQERLAVTESLLENLFKITSTPTTTSEITTIQSAK